MPINKKRPTLGYTSLKEMCRSEGINKNTWLYWEKRRPELSHEKLLELVKKRKSEKTELPFPSRAAALRSLGITHPVWGKYKKEHPEATELEIYHALKERVEKGLVIRFGQDNRRKPTLGFPSVAKMCAHYQINETTWGKKKKENPNLSDTDILKLVLPQEQPIEIEPIKNTPFERLFFIMEGVDDRKTNY
jgi:hypothetical protein